MRRESLKMPDEEWLRLGRLAAATHSHYLGKPSWRNLVRRIARGEVAVKMKPMRRNGT